MNQKNKTVWILLPNLGLGGAEIFLTSLVSELSQDYEFTFFVNNKSIEVPTSNVRVVTHSNTLQFFFRLLSSAWIQPPDVVLSSIIDVNIISLLLKKLTPKKIKYVIREALPIEEALKLTRAPNIYRWLAYQLYPSADAVISLSRELQDHLEEKIPDLKKQTKTFVIPNGVCKTRIQKPSIREQSNNKIISIGRLEYQKGFDKLIAAFSQFSSNNLDYELIIIGEGSQREELQALIRSLKKTNKIKLVGAMENPITELCTATFFALPSRYEGLSNAMLEALVNGVPVLATKMDTSAGDIINESNGVLINQCTEEEILAGLHEMDQKIGKFSREEIAITARKRFSISASAKAFSSLLSSI